MAIIFKELKQALKDPELDFYKNRFILSYKYRLRRWSIKVLFKERDLLLFFINFLFVSVYNVGPSSKKKGKGKMREGTSSSKPEDGESDVDMTDAEIA